MNDKTSYTLTGAFVLVLGALFVWGILWIAAGGAPQSVNRYVVYMTESVSGLNVDAALKYRGVQVGKVEDISIDRENPERIRLLLQVREGTPITVDTVATLDYQGLTGLATVNLSGGTSDSAPLARQPGEDYPVIAAEPSLFSRLDSTTSNLLGNLIIATDNINALLDEQNRAHLSQTLQSVAQLSADFAMQSGTMQNMVRRMDATLENLQQASSGLPALTRDAREGARSITRMANRLHDTSATLESVSEELARLLEETGGDVAQFSASALPEISVMLDDLRIAAGQLRRTSEALAEDPSVLVYGRQAPPPGPGETRR